MVVRRPTVVFKTNFDLLDEFKKYLAWKGYNTGTEAFNEYMRQCVAEYKKSKILGVNDG